MIREKWFDGMVGLTLADAYGAQTQGWNVPKYSWTDDTSMALATLDSIIKCDGVDTKDIMENFSKWLNEGKYSSIDRAFDIGTTCMTAINRYDMGAPVEKCGLNDERSNGNGSIMRILPVILYCISKGIDDKQAIEYVEAVSAITHAHKRSMIGCGIYYFIVKAVINGFTIQEGIDFAFYFYRNEKELSHYNRIKNYKNLCELPRKEIVPSGYVVETLEAALWCIGNSDDYEKCVLTVNTFNGDIDTIGAVAGGLAGIIYNIHEKYEQTSQIGVIKPVLKIMYEAAYKFCEKGAEDV